MSSSRCEIKLKNGAKRNIHLSLFCAVPSGIDGKVYPNVMVCTEMEPNDTRNFVVTEYFQVICGTMQGRPGHLVRPNVTQSKTVELGSSVEFDAEEGSPRLSNDVRNTGNEKEIEIRTGSGFSGRDNYFVGISRMIEDDSDFSKALTIIPEDSRVYRIRPSHVFYLAETGDIREGSLIDLNELGSDKVFRLDYDDEGGERVSVTRYNSYFEITESRKRIDKAEDLFR